MSLRRLTVAFLFKPFMWCHSDARLWHACYLFHYILILLWYYMFLYNMLTRIRVIFIFCDWRHEYKIFSAHRYYIIPVFIMFASTFKVLTGLSLAIVLARLLARRGATWWQPRNLSNGDSSLAKIGVNLVSCSRGKWSPIDTDDSQPASAINH